MYAYARRHTDAASADDVVAETFIIAWRRLSDVPADALPWLLVVARNTMANLRRAHARGQRLADELAALHRLAAHAPAVEHEVVDRDRTLAALAALTSLEREAVLLIAWDGLAPRDAARVADCTERAFNVRLHRARRRLARELDDSVSDPTLEMLR